MKWILDLLKSLFESAPQKGEIENPELPNHELIGGVVGSTQSAVQKKCLEIYGEATKEIGVSEYTSEGKKRIAEYHKKGVGKSYDYSTAWCSSFTNFIVKNCGLKGTDSAAARSFLKWGKSVDTPIKGCVVIFWRNGKDSAYGHVGVFSSETDTDIIVLGGNQGNQVSKKAYPKSRLLGYRVPVF